MLSVALVIGGGLAALLFFGVMMYLEPVRFETISIPNPNAGQPGQNPTIEKHIVNFSSWKFAVDLLMLLLVCLSLYVVYLGAVETADHAQVRQWIGLHEGDMDVKDALVPQINGNEIEWESVEALWVAVNVYDGEKLLDTRVYKGNRTATPVPTGTWSHVTIWYGKVTGPSESAKVANPAL
jgi:hypothetical protein